MLLLEKPQPRQREPMNVQDDTFHCGPIVGSSSLSSPNSKHVKCDCLFSYTWWNVLPFAKYGVHNMIIVWRWSTPIAIPQRA